jgi:hypothetical protein
MTPAIIEVERVPAGVLIVFEGGRSAVYSTVLLYELLPSAQAVIDDLGLRNDALHSVRLYQVRKKS